MEFWIKPENPFQNQEGEHLGPFEGLKLSCEDLRTHDNKVIAQLHDDNYWHLSKPYNKQTDVDGWYELTIYLKEKSNG